MGGLLMASAKVLGEEGVVKGGKEEGKGKGNKDGDEGGDGEE